MMVWLRKFVKEKEVNERGDSSVTIFERDGRN